MSSELKIFLRRRLRLLACVHVPFAKAGAGAGATAVDILHKHGCVHPRAARGEVGTSNQRSPNQPALQADLRDGAGANGALRTTARSSRDHKGSDSWLISAAHRPPSPHAAV